MQLSRPQPAARLETKERLSFVRVLHREDCAAAVEFLQSDPMRGVHLLSLITDHGIVNEKLRGSFYGYYEYGGLAGVALIGQHILCFGSDAAFKAFAGVTATQPEGATLFGLESEVESLWQHIAQQGRATKAVRAQDWMVCRRASLPVYEVQLQRAGARQVEMVATAQAAMIAAENGYNPLETDRAEFLRRVAERIARGRTWIKADGDTVVFKAELISVTDDAVYLEGIWTHPAWRGRGVATACVNELVKRLLHQHRLVCLGVEQHEKAARRVYEKVGFIRVNQYQVRHLQPLAQ